MRAPPKGVNRGGLLRHVLYGTWLRYGYYGEAKNMNPTMTVAARAMAKAIALSMRLMRVGWISFSWFILYLPPKLESWGESLRILPKTTRNNKELYSFFVKKSRALTYSQGSEFRAGAEDCSERATSCISYCRACRRTGDRASCRCGIAAEDR